MFSIYIHSENKVTSLLLTNVIIIKTKIILPRA
jgi:hypothetical protein